jgi:hypothetical protein
VKTLRRKVSELMVRVHQIAPELADYHIVQMDEEELQQRLRRYSGMELSVVERNQQSGPDFYQVFGSATATARCTALNPVPELPTEQESGRNNLPELEVKNLVRNPVRAG